MPVKSVHIGPSNTVRWSRRQTAGPKLRRDFRVAQKIATISSGFIPRGISV